MAYTTKYTEDSDADDEFERSAIQSPTLPVEYESSPTSSGPLSTEHTPTTFTHSRDSKGSPTGLITEWTAEQSADFVSDLGLDQYYDTFVDECIIGEALVALQHAELKEMGINSVGHRLSILKAVYEIKVKQNVPIEPEHYVPLSADTAAQDAPPTQDDFAKVIRVVQARDERIHATESELRHLRDDLNRVLEENKRLREEILPLVRMLKDSQQPLPTPHEHSITSPPATQERAGSSLSPSLGAGQQMSPNSIPQPSPTSPAYTQNRPPYRSDIPRSAHPDLETNTWSSQNNTWTSESTLVGDRRGTRDTPQPLSSRPPLRNNPQTTPNPDERDPPLSGGSTLNNQSSSAAQTPLNPQVEIFKSFRVSIDDPCHKVLPVALKKYNITADWRQYALYIVHGDQERCLGLNERPLILFKQLDKEGRKPMFMLRKHAAPAEGHVSTVGGNDIRSVNPGGFGWDGQNRQQVPGGVL